MRACARTPSCRWTQWACIDAGVTCDEVPPSNARRATRSVAAGELRTRSRSRSAPGVRRSGTAPRASTALLLDPRRRRSSRVERTKTRICLRGTVVHVALGDPDAGQAGDRPTTRRPPCIHEGQAWWDPVMHLAGPDSQEYRQHQQAESPASPTEPARAYQKFARPKIRVSPGARREAGAAPPIPKTVDRATGRYEEQDSPAPAERIIQPSTQY